MINLTYSEWKHLWPKIAPSFHIRLKQKKEKVAKTKLTAPPSTDPILSNTASSDPNMSGSGKRRRHRHKQRGGKVPVTAETFVPDNPYTKPQYRTLPFLLKI